MFMRNAVDDAINELRFDEESYNFLKTIGYLDGLNSALYRLIAEGMPQHRPYDLVANELARFGRRWSSRHLLPPTAQRQVQRYQRSHQSSLRPAHKFDMITIHHHTSTDQLQDHFRKFADMRYEKQTLPLRNAARLSPLQESGEAKESRRIRFHPEVVQSLQNMNVIQEASVPCKCPDLNENDAATRLQSVYRGRLVRKQLDTEGRYQDAIRAEIHMDGRKQQDSEGRTVPCTYPDLNENEAVTKLQSVYRDRLVRKQLDTEGRYQDAIRAETHIDDTLRNEKPSSTENSADDTAATTIQKHWRKNANRKRMKQENEAATRIQKIIRGRQARKTLAMERNARMEQNDDAESEEHAAIAIQKAWRKHRPMESINENEEEEDGITESLETERRTTAAITIQKKVRGHQQRLNPSDLADRDSAAIMIQKHVRGRQTRATLQATREEQADEMEPF